VSDDTVITVRDLTKTYRLYASRADRVKETFHPFRKAYHRPFHALKGVSFEVKRGETLGIVGRNGSGKSTLLQIICGVLQPTSGSVEVKGRVSALLELGSGFNPEFTGRQNVYLNAAILGLERREIERRLPQIEAFADIGAFIDQPVRTYSSGMYLRLAFAVAVSVDPEILVVDEALAVGDEVFQRKCYSRIHEMRRAGATILFVSHSAPTVVELCNRAVLIDQGELLLDGPPKHVVGRYHKLLYAPAHKIRELREGFKSAGLTSAAQEICLDDAADPPLSKGKAACVESLFDPSLVPSTTISYEMRGAAIISPRVTTPEGRIVNVLVSRSDYVYTYDVEFRETAYNVRFAMLIKTVTGFELAGAASSQPQDAYPVIEAGSVMTVAFPFRCALMPAVYFLNAGVLAVVNGEEIYLHRIIDAAMFRVQPPDSGSPRPIGIVDLFEDPIAFITRKG
jgi:lipopolysaccharide transport system ATP-binding protein